MNIKVSGILVATPDSPTKSSRMGRALLFPAERDLEQTLSLGIPERSCQRFGNVMKHLFLVIMKLLKAALWLEREQGSRHSTPGTPFHRQINSHPKSDAN